MHRKVYNWSIDYVELGRREYMLFAGTHPLLLCRLNFAEINRNVEIGGESDRQDFIIACEVSLIETMHILTRYHSSHPTIVDAADRCTRFKRLRHYSGSTRCTHGMRNAKWEQQQRLPILKQPLFFACENSARM